MSEKSYHREEWVRACGFSNKTNQEVLDKVLSAVKEKLNLNAEVIQKDIFEEKDIETDLIIARAFKPLPIVLDLANRNFKKFKSVIVFLGKNRKKILDKALTNWSFDYKEKISLTSADSKIIKICNLKKK